MSRPITDAYLVAINADTEQTVFQAEFGFIPPGIREGMVLDASGFGQLWGSRLAQLNNRVYGMGAKWNSLELNRSTLGGGGEYINPGSTRQTGEWSRTQSREDGTFEEPPYIEMTFDAAYDLIGAQIIFDDLGEEWAAEIAVAYYDNSFTLLGERTFTNDRASMSINWQYDGVRQVRFTINRWNLPRRFCKVCQVIPGQIRYFRDENTYSFLLRESISPFGALVTPEYSIVFPNENQEYNIINPEGVTAKLRGRMEIPTQIGLITAVGIENISTGNFFLFSWPDSANEETAAFYCRPDLAFANNNYIFDGNLTQTVSQVADLISTQAGFKTPINVDASLSSGQINAKIDLENRVPLQDAFGQLAIAAGGIVKFERNGSYTLKPLIYGAPTRVITFDNMWEKPDIKQEQAISGVTVKYTVYIPYRPPTELNPGVPEQIRNVELFISAENETGRNVTIMSNFILNASEAQRIGQMALNFYSKRLTYRINYRGDMSIEAGDVVSVETDFGFMNILVTEHEISYNATEFLQGRIVGVGIDS